MSAHSRQRVHSPKAAAIKKFHNGGIPGASPARSLVFRVQFFWERSVIHPPDPRIGRPEGFSRLRQLTAVNGFQPVPLFQPDTCRNCEAPAKRQAHIDLAIPFHAFQQKARNWSAVQLRTKVRAGEQLNWFKEWAIAMIVGGKVHFARPQDVRYTVQRELILFRTVRLVSARKKDQLLERYKSNSLEVERNASPRHNHRLSPLF